MHTQLVFKGLQKDLEFVHNSQLEADCIAPGLPDRFHDLLHPRLDPVPIAGGDAALRRHGPYDFCVRVPAAASLADSGSEHGRPNALLRCPGCRRAAARMCDRDTTHPQHAHDIGIAQSPRCLHEPGSAPLRILEVLAQDLPLVSDVTGAASQPRDLVRELIPCVIWDDVAAVGVSSCTGIVGAISAGAVVVSDVTIRRRRRLVCCAPVVPPGAGPMIRNRRRLRRSGHCAAGARTSGGWSAKRRARGIGCGRAAASSKATAAATS